MAEESELKLSIVLDDRAAVAGLKQLKYEIANLGAGPSNLPRLRREVVDLGASVRPVTEQVNKASEALSAFARGSTLAIGAAAGIGFAMYQAGQRLKTFSDEMQQLQNLSRETGQSAGNLKAIGEQMRQMGVGNPEKEIRGVTAAIADLHRRGSTIRQDLMKGGPAGMATFLQSLMGDPATDIPKIVAHANKIFRDELDRSDAGRAANTRSQFLGKFGLTTDRLIHIREFRKQPLLNSGRNFVDELTRTAPFCILNVVGPLRKASAEEEATARRRIELAKQFNESMWPRRSVRCGFPSACGP
jgi:hypothetical protein